MLASKLLGVVGIFMMANYAAVNGRCWKPCPPFWSQWRNKCYKMPDADVTWEEGKQICVEMGGVMVVTQSKEELQHLVNMSSGKGFWIGCNDIETEGTWECLGEGPIEEQNEMWAFAFDTFENCALGSASGWHDVTCYRPEKLICQRPIAPALLLL